MVYFFFNDFFLFGKSIKMATISRTFWDMFFVGFMDVTMAYFAGKRGFLWMNMYVSRHRDDLFTLFLGITTWNTIVNIDDVRKQLVSTYHPSVYSL